ncbi:S-methyl-5'-thioinosine phosphorylase [Lamprobacter modestohalophilus]|uniref:S-methyl-5'-thioinosine phosphorylase n=1 Tax=Lamprobacter modestohalophilus TaxID=1064514 RepID=UPI002ADEC876|nr:S-methyl-5'-thioinosine phosphorylase [Lamprobacter modestohalophilus]MEA1050365.1 S-methyl-5'-thioinosine phosphorylase [Lamprobacter modestohalophilus]
MSVLAIIGGSGFSAFPGLEVRDRQPIKTPYGTTSAPLVHGRIGGQPVCFLARHGSEHRLPPHRINYRANIQALADAGCSSVVALGAVGGIHPACSPGTLCVPDQLIDYTYGRAHSFFDDESDGVRHVDFTEPYSQALRQRLLAAAAAAGIALRDGGTYAVSQGPRLETAAEVRRMARDGCDLVGMTAMPEAALARERDLGYATLAFVVNWGAGLSDEAITMDAINAQIERCADDIGRLLAMLAEQRAAPVG